MNIENIMNIMNSMTIMNIINIINIMNILKLESGAPGVLEQKTECLILWSSSLFSKSEISAQIQ